MQEIRICALMLDPYDKNPGQRFRIEQWERFLNKQNIYVEYFPFTDNELRQVLYQKGHILAKARGMVRALVRRRRQIKNARKYDLVYLFRAASMVGPAYFERVLARSGTPFIYDFDDAIYLTDTSEANRRFGWLKFAGKTAKICKLANAVTVGNSHLAAYARKYNENVYIVPTSIDTEKYEPIERAASLDVKTIIGWTGSMTSQYHLEAFEPTLAEILKRFDVELKVISDRKPSFREIDCEWQPWSAAREVEITSEMDIGIMPIPDDEWSRGKCAAKALQYMALGIPTVCSDVGANKEVIRNGINGFLAKSTEDWLKYIELLVGDKSLRKRIGAMGRATVVEEYSMEKCADLFARAVLETIGHRF